MTNSLDQIEIKDSNLANYGSDEHLALRLEAAKTAEEWRGAGAKPGLQIWRVEKLNVKPWPAQRYGEFYNGDSYIILNTYQRGDSKALAYDVHFWIGVESTQDEYTIAAYKTVELDDLLGDVPVQHREVEGYESDLFLSYFSRDGSRPFRILQGGIESGFKKGGPQELKPRLFHLKGRRVVQSVEVARKTSSLNTGDVFVLDMGTKIFIWEPKKANRVEKFSATILAGELRAPRPKGSCEIVYLDEEGSDEFWASLEGTRDQVMDASAAGSDDAVAEKRENRLYRLSDASGSLRFTKVAEGKLQRDMLTSDDVDIIDLGKVVYIYVGANASADERKNSMRYANKYLMDEKRPMTTPVTRVLQGAEPKDFIKALA